ncbi:MAG: hypothetical protein KC493_12645 [Bacteriovoracaceae bacterium]|nr:hypothetical protein [Bacteriovoracaceae bacterium]
MIELANNFTSDTDDQGGIFEFSRMTNQAYLGAAIGAKGKLFFGQNVTSFSRSYTTGAGTVEVSTLELGPRFQIYFSEALTWNLSMTWNPYAKGERTGSGTTSDIDGWSYEIGLGYQYKISKRFYMGATVVYHALNITTVTDSANLETETTFAYTSIYPLLTLNMRF